MATTKILLSTFLQRFVLPISLISCIVFRPSGLGFIYLLILLYIPWVPVIDMKNIKGQAGCFWRFVLCVSVLAALAQIIFQITLFSLPPYGSFLENCTTTEKIIRHVGLVRLDELSVADVIRWVSPEIVFLLSTVILYVLVHKINQKPEENITQTEGDKDIKTEGEVRVQTAPGSPPAHRQSYTFHINVGKFVVLALIWLTACLRPSIPSAFYFMYFMAVTSSWAIYQKLERSYGISLRCIGLLNVVHLLALYAVQFQWPQEFLVPGNVISRVLGLTSFYTVSCDEPRIFTYVDSTWATIVNPFAIVLCYYLIVIESALLLKPQPKKKSGTFSKLESGSFNGSITRHMSQRLSRTKLIRSSSGTRATQDRWKSATRQIRVITRAQVVGPPTETTPLIRGVSPARRSRTSASHPGSGQADQAGENIPMSDVGSQEMELMNTSRIGLESSTQERDRGETCQLNYQPSVMDHIVVAIEHIFQLIIRSSYIATNIIMMVWSITYFSWLTFVLLLSANIIWMTPNKRMSMLWFSPVLVFYAQLLLIIDFIFGMDLTEDEMSTTIDGWDMTEVGFSRPIGEPCVRLLVKTLFTLMFWITLRQLVQERRRLRQCSTIADMVAPLQVTVGTATAALPRQEDVKTSPFMTKFGEIIKSVMIRCWIWVVAIMLFVIGFTGKKMTVFRILYMALFLVFILTFQISWRAWRKILKVFLITVIGYSMIILILIYTYQFKKASYYWSEYLLIPVQLQMDIGMESYEPGELFLKLATPTCFVIVTIIQIHYCHKDFLLLTEMKSRNSSLAQGRSTVGSAASSAQGGTFNPPATPIDKILNSPGPSEPQSQLLTKDSLQLLTKIKIILVDAIEIIFQALELHLNKLIMISIMLLAIYNVQAVHIIFVLLVVIIQPFDSRAHNVITMIVSVVVGVLFILKMIYQIEYIQQATYDVNCTFNETVIKANNAEWLGFYKKNDKTLPLSVILKGYIGILVVTTVHAGVKFRQTFARFSAGKPMKKPYLMFPNVGRVDADKSTIHCLKYLANYGYYKFGLEVCLIATVGLIGVRMDFYAVLYAIWLCALFALPRETAARVWTPFVIFLIVFICLQYFFVVGLPPILCVFYPWDYNNTILEKTQEWMFLPDPFKPPHAYKLLCDFILLVLACRQNLVFRIEKRFSGSDYPGGSNGMVTQHAEEPGFVNPVPDFISNIKTWLDVFKRILYMSLLWVTLAFVFLAGSLRVSIFSVGYLIGSFYFLWQGTDLYLRPIDMIIKSWNGLLGFNVVAIFLKTVLQIIGCIFINEVETAACWFIQLFGIGCIQKFTSIVKTSYGSDECRLPREDIGLAWDGVCFAFLLLQRRLFNSYYFFHVINEAKAMTMLASRGAELKQEIQVKKMAEQEDEEKRILEKIRQKMERIKATQKKIQGPAYQERKGHETHFTDYIYGPEQRPQYRTRQPTTHLGESQGPVSQSTFDTAKSRTVKLSRQKTIRSGDYYMFDEFDDTELDLVPSKSRKDDHDSTDTLQQTTSRGLTVGELLASAITTDIDTATQYHRRGTINFRRTSMPLARQQSTLSYKSARSHMSAPLPGAAEGASRGRRHSKDSDNQDNLSPPPEDELDHEVSEASDEPSEISVKTTTQAVQHQVFRWVRFIWAFLESCMVSITNRLNIYSRDYRYVVRVLAKEKVELKAQPNFGAGMRQGFSMIWTPLQPSQSTTVHKTINGDDSNATTVNTSGTTSPEEMYRRALAEEERIEPDEDDGEMHSLQQIIPTEDKKDRHTIVEVDSYERTGLLFRRKASQLTVPEIRIMAPSLERGLDSDHPYGESCVDVSPMDEYEKADLSLKDQPPLIRMILSIWYILLSHSDIACYCMIFLHQIKSANLLSLPLPLMVFLWGTLSVPRPSKTFWVTLIAYTQTIVLIKCMFQFEFMPWNSSSGILSNSPFLPAKIIGIYKKQNYATYDLCLLLVVFFHRAMLKYLGQWKSSSSEEYLESGMYHMEVDTKNNKSEEEEEEVEEESKSHEASAGPSSKPPTEGKSSHTSGHSSSVFSVPETDATSYRSGEEHDLSTADVPPPVGWSVAGGSGDDRGGGDNKYQSPARNTPDGDNESSNTVLLQTTRSEPYTGFPGTFLMGLRKYSESVQQFFVVLLQPSSRVTTNVYAFMFICDFFNFLVIIFGFSSFGQGDGSVLSYLEENKVPIPFLVMLILQFLLIVTDRALFLRKNIFGKIVFQYILVIAVHIWMFFILPAITERDFNKAIPPQMWYVVKCIYLLFSAFQIRSGYPTRILGNFLCKRYNIVNKTLFMVYMNIPFLFELRTVMDWIWTNTSMTLFDWLKMEDIFATIFGLKCARNFEDQFPAARGVKKPSVGKYLQGGMFLFAIIAIIWFPLVFFALGNSVGSPNIPHEVLGQVRIGSSVPAWMAASQGDRIDEFTELDWTKMANAYRTDRSAQTQLSNYEHRDVAAVNWTYDSRLTWDISSPDLNILIAEARSNKSIPIYFRYLIRHAVNSPEHPEDIAEERYVLLNNANDTQLLADILENKSNKTLLVKQLLPKFLKVYNKGIAVNAVQLMRHPKDVTLEDMDLSKFEIQTENAFESQFRNNENASLFRNINLKLNRELPDNLGHVQMWWSMTESCDDPFYKDVLQQIPYSQCNSYVLYLFNEKIFPGKLNFLSGAGIIGLYSTTVILIWRVSKGITSGGISKIIFEDLPSVDRVLQLCLDIYLVREANEFVLEEDLFAKLIFLFRSPETLIKWTRPVEDNMPIDDDASEVHPEMR